MNKQIIKNYIGIVIGLILSFNVGLYAWSGIQAQDGDKLSVTKWNELTSYIWGKNGLASYYTTGFVGIGTTAPTGVLEIRNDGNGGAAGNPLLRLINLSGNSTGFSFLQLVTDTGQGGIWKNSGVQTQYAGTGSINIGTAAGENVGIVANNQVRIFVEKGGNIGVGTNLPYTKLDVNGSIKSYNNIISSPWFSINQVPQGPWQPGYIKLKTPIGSHEENMFSIKIKGYRYGIGGAPVEIICGGYSYISSGFISSGCNTDGTSDPVGIGVDSDGKIMITIGSGGSTWYFDHFTFDYHGWKPKNPDDFTWNWVYNTAPTTSNTNNVFVDDKNASVYIGAIDTSYKLYVNGKAGGTTAWTQSSDQRFKKNIKTIDSALDKISKLRGVTFDWKTGEFKDKNFPKENQVGFIAQEVEKVIPQVVKTDSSGYKGVEYSNITAVLVEAVKELKQENEKLKEDNKLINEKLNELIKK